MIRFETTPQGRALSTVLLAVEQVGHEPSIRAANLSYRAIETAHYAEQSTATASTPTGCDDEESEPVVPVGALDHRGRP